MSEKYSFKELRSCLTQERKKPTLTAKKVRDTSIEESDLDRLIEMAWQDRLPFDIIYEQYGLTENQVKKKMRSLVSKKAYNRWRKRVQGRATKHTKKCAHKPSRFQGPW